MVVLVDSREKVNDHIIDYFNRKGINYKKKTLSYGDYSFYIPMCSELTIPRDIYFDSRIMVERKGSLEELSNNLTKERDRFEKELALAPEQKIILVENADYKDVVTGNYNTQYNKKSYWATIHSFWFKYNVSFVFMPHKECTGQFIRGYFEYYLKNLIR